MMKYISSAVLVLFLNGCAMSTQSLIRESFDAAQSVSLGGESVIKKACVGLAQECINEGKNQGQCQSFAKCKRLYDIFMQASEASITTLSLAEAARASGDEPKAKKLLALAQKALFMARDIVEKFLGVDEALK